MQTKKSNRFFKLWVYSIDKFVFHKKYIDGIVV
jgi:hypothetical protein